MSAADIREIAQTEISRARDELSQAAAQAAEARIQSLIDRVTEHFSDKPELFAAFGEPDFQYSLQDAGRAAASNDDEHTEQLLVDLLANRAAESTGARVRLATSQAVRAADKLSLEALNGITGLWGLSFLEANIDSPQVQVTWAAQLTQTLLGIGLPSGIAWMQDADALNLHRLQGGVVSRRTYAEFLHQKVAHHLNPGLSPDEDRDLLAAVKKTVPEIGPMLTAHPLKEGFVRLPGKTRDDFTALLPGDLLRPPELDQLIEKNGHGAQDQAALDTFNTLLSAHPSISEASAWWDPLPAAEFRVIGDVIGFVNTRRYVPIDDVQTVGELLQRRAA